jgi:hypothetical protein
MALLLPLSPPAVLPMSVLLPLPLSALSALADGALLQPTASTIANNTGIIPIKDFFIGLNPPLKILKLPHFWGT